MTDNLIPFPPPRVTQDTIESLLDVGFAQDVEIRRLRLECDRLKAEAAALANHAEEQTAVVGALAEDLARIPDSRRVFWSGFVLGCLAATVAMWVF
jgi:hypothetical protein